ncbi:hypothetical protein TNCV_1993681 [Trichonephila clavipes]|nr:hypothetical protein TNCV_1993681 [Trichonephila clavipes]
MIWNHIEMQGRKHRSCELCHKEAEKKNRKKQHINGTENILLNGCTSAGAQNYDRKAYGRPISGAAWNSLRSGRFLRADLW